MSSEHEGFRLTAPPLSDYIRGILNRYPDGSQILKELLQNAEDAGASVVKYFYDDNTFATNNLFLETLEDSQGPALCVFNDAQFQPCDWKGIQELQRSHKAGNIFKVGKFGIGFNSIYHITDMPWLLSGKRLVVMEPTETRFRASGFQWLLDSSEHQTEMRNCSNQFLPIESAANVVHPQGASFMNQWQFDGTLFRLPLRAKPSIMSSTVYTNEMIKDLFDNFAQDGPGLILFLLNVEKIEVFIRNGNSPPVNSYSLKIASCDSNRVKGEKILFSQHLHAIAKTREENKELTQGVTMNVHFVTEEVGQQCVQKKWIVSHFVPSQTDAPTAWSLQKNVKRLPWVSVAAQVESPVEGRIFCFLPLPNNPEIVTGLPIHINAYFGLEDNRRNLKWPSVDQNRDVDAEWNKSLRDEVIPHAYVQLICFCRDQCSEASYLLWPKISNVHERWMCLLLPFYKLLLSQSVLMVSSTNIWTYMTSNLFVDNLDKTCQANVATAVRYWLNRVQTYYTHVPENVIEGIEYYCQLTQFQINYVTPSVVSKELTEKCQNWVTDDIQNVLLLLHYFVTNESVDYNVVCRMWNLPLIPLRNGNFGRLQQLDNVNVLYLASKKHQELLPTLNDRIINEDVVSEAVVQFLNRIVGMKYGVEKIDEGNFWTILKQILPDVWKSRFNFNCNLSSEVFPNRTWLEKLWQLLRQDYPTDISSFIGLTILEYSQQNGYSNLTELPPPDKSILFKQGVFPPLVEQLLVAVNAIPLPSEVMQRHNALDKYIHSESTASLINLLQNIEVQKLEAILLANEGSRRELVHFLAKSLHEISSDGRTLVRKLPIFDVLVWPRNSSRKAAVSIDYCSTLGSASSVNFNGLPPQVEPDKPLIDCRDDDYSNLATWLGVTRMSEAEVANGIINNRNNYPVDVFSILMLWCMDFIQPWNMKIILKDFNFVQTEDGSFRAPSSLFDPNVSELKVFFSGEIGKFPSGSYESPKTLEFLRGLGLRTSINEITPEEILQTACEVNNLGCGVSSKRNYLVEVLKTQVDKLSTTQVAQMRSLKLFHAKTNPPPDYPTNLLWFGTGKDDVCYSATDLVQEECSFIIGSVMPVLGNSLPQRIIDVFRFLSSGDIETRFLISHLKIISERYNQMSVHSPSFQSTLHKLFKALSVNDPHNLQTNLDCHGMKKWIWAGGQFLEPNQIVIKWNHFDSGLAPYLHSLPEFLQEESLVEMFRNIGVLEDDGVGIGRRVLQEIILKHHSGPVSEEECKTDICYVRKILEIISENLEEDEDVQVPIKRATSTLKFLSASQCKYNDSGSYDNFFDGCEDEDEDDDVILVHSDLPNDLCRKLGVSPLSTAVLEAEEFEQQESMLQRLKNILDEYPAGATIFQELIQNADDAGASEIGFLLDLRDNAQWRRSVLWKESGMDKFQGPALWTFNNALFSEDDFKNILSVGGATKRSQSEKIGSFGVGFNSVYHVTDIPSFVSGHFLVFFDPHKFCIPNTAGIKFNLLKKPKKLKAFSDQFSPYKDVFDCDLSYRREGVNYPHTLFRLPLRDVEMATRSQLSETVYDMKQLLQRFVETRQYVMLFLQHINTLRALYLSKFNSSPSNSQTILTIKKTLTVINSNLTSQEIFTKVVKSQLNQNQLAPLNQASLVKMDISMNNYDGCLPIAEIEGNSEKSWIIQWNASTGAAYQLASTDEGKNVGLMPAVAIAACVEIRDERFKIFPLPSGLVFCYLPLPVNSGLPFHIHAPFALASNRRHLWGENDRDEGNVKTRWNEALKTEALVECFIRLLQVIKSLDENNQLLEYKFYCLWPLQGVAVNDFSRFVIGVYTQLFTPDKNLWKSEDSKWIAFSQARFLLLSPQWSENFILKARKALQIALPLTHPETGFILLSPEVLATIQTLFPNQLESQAYVDETFFAEIFFPNLQHFDQGLVNDILLEILAGSNIQKPYLRKLLQETCCIPSSPDGERRLRPGDLVDFQSKVSKLFDEEDGKFAHGSFRQAEIRSKLLLLGSCKTPTIEMLLDRATTVQALVQAGFMDKANIRSNLILNYLTDDNVDDSCFDKFSVIPFMFAQQPLEKWKLPWYDSGKEVFTPKELFFKKHQNVVCFVAPIWDDKGILTAKTHKLAYHLRLDRKPDPELVLTQLDVLSKLEMANFSKTQFEQVQRMAADCLKLLQAEINTNSSRSQVLLTRTMAIQCVILKPTGAVPYCNVSCGQLRMSYAPYLFTIKDTAYEECKQLLQRCGIKETFSIECYINALKNMQRNFGETALPETELQIALDFCRYISWHLAGLPEQQRLVYREELLIPDFHDVLRSSSSLTFWELDLQEIPHELLVDANFCSRDLPRDTAIKLGVSLQRQAVLEKFSTPFFEDGESFGQYEGLTTRIKGLLVEYSNKFDVFSEMIQNADDAGATDIRFILDMRQLSTNPKTLLSENWKHLQGPALIVYNNKPFTQADFAGIRNLGLGSKRDDSELTGKFGVGFNTVYSLTDVPMFISNGEKLCVLDPHRQYVPTATVIAPGGLFKISPNFKKIYPDVLAGFEPVEDLEFANSTVFRFPLRNPTKNMTSEIDNERVSVDYLKKTLTDLGRTARDYLFFLRNVQKIQITVVNEKGKVIDDAICRAEMTEENRNKKMEFFETVRRGHLSSDSVVHYSMYVIDRFTKDPEEWLISQRVSCLRSDVPQDVIDMINAKKLVAMPIVGIAAPLSLATTNKTSKIFNTLPLPGTSSLPVHINARFILDAGRKHVYLHNDSSYKTKWNNYLIDNVMAQLYVQLLENLKELLREKWSITPEYVLQEALARKYQTFFPANLGEMGIGILLMKKVYQLIQANHAELLFGVKLSKGMKRELLWLNLASGIMDLLIDRKEYKTGAEKGNSLVMNVRNVLEKVDFPKFHLGFNTLLGQLSLDLNLIFPKVEPNLVAAHLTKIKDEKLIRMFHSQSTTNCKQLMLPSGCTASSLPTQIENTILSVDEIRHCLKFILQDGEIDLNNIPLLLTADNILRRFRRGSELYLAHYFYLLPSQGEFFCSPEMDVSSLPNYCQDFTVTSIANHLRVELPYLENVIKLEVDRIDNLICLILNFLTNVRNEPETILNNKNLTNTLIQHIQPLENWALLPVSIVTENRSRNYLVPLKNAPLAVFETGSHQLYLILRKMGCTLLNLNLLQNVRQELTNFFSNICVTSANPSLVVKLLHSVNSNQLEDADFCRIIEVDKLNLLEYITSNYSCLGKPYSNDKWHDISTIKSLPIFQTLEGNFVSVTNSCTYISCTGEVERAELDKLMSLSNIALLTSNLGRCCAQFCKNFDIKVMQPIEVYKSYIIEWMNNFSLKSIVKHMNWIKMSNETDSEIRSKLGGKLLIRTDSGAVKAVKDFYSSCIQQQFGTMMSEDNFIPESFWAIVEEEFKNSGKNVKDEWESFFKTLGLKEKLESNVFLDLAKKLERNKDFDNNVLEESSRLLVGYLQSEYQLYNDNQLLDNLKTVKFVYAHVVEEELSALYKQNGLVGLICYQDNVKQDQEKICWSVCKLLPNWSTRFGHTAVAHLGYCSSPTINHVVAHAENICNLLQPMKYSEIKAEGVNSDGAIRALRSVLEEIYKFLEQNINIPENLLETLKNVPCILVESGRKLVCAGQVVSDSFTECPPFLYVLPEDLFPFIKVLQLLGTERKITCHHYITALKMIHAMFGETQINNPNMKTSLKNVYIGFLTEVSQIGPEKVSVHILYLPDENSCMQKSTDILVFTENPEDFTTIVGKKWNTLMLRNIGMPLIKCADLLMRLPQIIRPTSFKQFMTEILSEECEHCDQEFCEHAYNIERLIHNSLFVEVIFKIISSFEMHLEAIPVKQDEFTVFFKSIKVICYKELKVMSYNRETNQQLGEVVVPTFCRKTSDNVVEFLVAHEISEIRESLADNLLTLLKMLSPMRSRTHEFFMTALLEKLNLETQTESLRNLKRRYLHEYEEKKTYQPVLGSLLTKDLVSLLDQNCSCVYYEPFDYVACRRKGNEEETVYIFGQIVKEVEKPQSSKYIKWYLVNIGDAEPVEKSTLEIHKFLNVEEMEEGVQNAMGEELGLFEMQTEANAKFSKSLDEVLEEISDQLENYWKLSDDDRKLAIRRMYLYWHPDKNPADKSEFCGEVFKYLKNEIERLQKGQKRKSKSQKYHKDKNNSAEWFNKWNSQAQKDKTRKENYYKRAKSDWDYFSSSTRESGVPPTFAKSFNSEAKLWFEQAKCNLTLAQRETLSENVSYEWVFYIYHQVARLSMIAMLFTRLPNVNQNANLMELALDVAIVFGVEMGDVCKIVKSMIRNGVDDIRTINPRFGRTPRDNYKQYVGFVQEVGDSAKKLMEIATRVIENLQEPNLMTIDNL